MEPQSSECLARLRLCGLSKRRSELTTQSLAPRKIRGLPPALVSTAVALLVWQVLTTWGPIADLSIPSVIETAEALAAEVSSSLFYKRLWETIQMSVIGFVLAMMIAIPVGVLLGLSRFAWRSSKFTFDFFKVIPPIVIIPIVILVLGPTMRMGVFLIVFTLIFAMAIQTGLGVRDADAVLLETMRCYGMSTWQQIRYARLPSAAAFIAVGVRLSASAALVVAVVAGLIGGAPGLGRSILLAQASGEDARTFATVFVLGILGIAVSRAVTAIQRRVVFWMPS